MKYVRNFGLKFLENVNTNEPIQNDIIIDVDCFFHSLEYAKGKIGLYKDDSDYINKKRRQIVEAVIDHVGPKYKVEGVRSISDYKDPLLKLWAENIIIREAAIFSNKCLFIIQYFPHVPANNGLVTLIQPRGVKFTTHNILFMINTNNTHFITFRSNNLAGHEILNQPIHSTHAFIDRLKELLTNEELFVDLSKIDNDVKESKVNVYSFSLRDFDSTIFINHKPTNSEKEKTNTKKHKSYNKEKHKPSNTKKHKEKHKNTQRHTSKNQENSNWKLARKLQESNNAEYARELQKKDISNYAGKLQKEMQNGKIAKKLQEKDISNYAGRLQQEMQNAKLAKKLQEKDISNYAGHLQKKMQNAEMVRQKQMQNAEMARQQQMQNAEMARQMQQQM